MPNAKPSLRLIFAGTPEFAATALERILRSAHSVVAVYTQPDRPAGRGLKLTKSPVKVLAEQQQLPVEQPTSLKDPQAQAKLAQYQADILVVAAYGLLLPSAVLTIPPLGCINIHPSLLPRWRGAAPIQRTVQAGDSISGVTIMQMDAGLDTGPILLQYHYCLQAGQTSQSLHDSLASMGADAMVEALDLLAVGKLAPIAQDDNYATYAQKLNKEEARIDWQRPATELEHLVCAFNPWPVAFTVWQGAPLKIGKACALCQPHTVAAGTVVAISAEGIDVATGDGVLRLQQVQVPGGKMIAAYDFYQARKQLLVIGQPLS